MDTRKVFRLMLWVCCVVALAKIPAMGANILFISAMDETTKPGDDALKAYLEGLGHTVTYFDDDETEANMEAAALQSDLVFMSESVGSAKVKTKITGVEVPMVIAEAWGWYEMGLTQAACIGLAVATPDVNIVDPENPLAAKLTGTVSVLTDITGTRGAARFAQGVAGSEAQVAVRATLSDGTTYDVIFAYEKGAVLPSPPADGSPRFAADIRVCFGFDEQSYLLWNENAYALLGAAVNCGLGIRIQPEAYNPYPGDKRKDIPRNVILSWKQGMYGKTHNVYLGTRFEDVNEATATDPRGVLVSQGQDGLTFDAGQFDYGRTYYWRVDEVNAAPDLTVYKGDVWTFDVINAIVVDDFESYNDACSRISYAWKGGSDIGDNVDCGVIASPGNGTGSIIGNDAPPYAEQTIVHGGKQSLPLRYDNSKGPFISEGVRTFDSAQDWTRDGVADLSVWFVGFPPYVSSFTPETGGRYKMVGIGRDLYDNSDQCHFAYKAITGAVTIVAKVESIQNLNTWVKAGIMIRETLSGNARNTSLVLTPGNGLRFQYRPTPDAPTNRQFDPNLTAPYWLKMERTVGGLIRAYRSLDGTTWTRFDLVTLQMSNPVYVGLTVTSHDMEVPAEAVFSNVTVTGTGSTTPWEHQDIGITTNAPEPVYVALNDGTPIYYEDPNASLIHSWTQWMIPLQRFADQGIDLSRVTRMTIGVGTKTTATPRGAGRLYIDDLRLNRPLVSP